MQRRGSALVRDALQQVQQQEAAEEAVGAGEQYARRLRGQLRGRGGRGGGRLVGVRQEAVQLQVGCLDVHAVVAVNRLEGNPRTGIAAAGPDTYCMSISLLLGDGSVPMSQEALDKRLLQEQRKAITLKIQTIEVLGHGGKKSSSGPYRRSCTSRAR